MSNSKHTPGQWKVAPNGSIVTDDHSQTISPCIENKANTLLIAAAPDMRAALVDLVALAEEALLLANRDGAEFNVDAELREACAAIAKAEGR